jgi:diguanylate cyclase (GGDEF)-like protein
VDENPPAGSSWPLLEGLAQPAVAIDEQGRIVFLNARAEAFWGLRLADVAGRPAREALRIGPPEPRPLEEWLRAVVRPALESGAPVPAQVVARHDRVHLVELTGIWESRDGRRYVLLTLSERSAQGEAGAPRPAPRDPATGLLKLDERTAEYSRWNMRSGTAVLFDLDALRETNALYGMSVGDTVLATAGRVLAAEAPPGTLAGRYGDDELVLLFDQAGPDEAEEVARRVVERVARETQAAGVPAVPRLHYGIAAFAPQGLGAGLRQAEDKLYQRRGVLLQASSGGRVVLTREGRAALQKPGGDGGAAAPGSFASSFSVEFDSYFRQAYARSVEQAREFVAFVDPEPGSAVVEVGAGSGRITFDGGLAERVGRRGQLLVTDPSAAQLEVARKRAADLGFDWVRFVCAPVEALPLQPGTADLCLGAVFLHFTEPADAIRAMARVVRAGGRVAVNALGDIPWPPAWQEILEPVSRVLRAHGLAVDIFTPPELLVRQFRHAGLVVDRVEEATEPVDYRTAEIAAAVWRQTRFVALLLRRLPPQAAHGVEEEFERRLRDVWRRARPEELVLRVAAVSIVGHR